MDTHKVFKKSLLTASVLAGLYGASATHATIVDESTFGEFSNDLSMPTSLPAGTTGITGAFGVDGTGRDAVVFLDLPTGIQTFKFNATLMQRTADHFLDVDKTGTFFEIEGDSGDNISTMLQTDMDFNGELRVLLYEEGESTGYVSYSLELHPVPIPAAALLFASGLGALGAAKARRKAKRRV